MSFVGIGKPSKIASRSESVSGESKKSVGSDELSENQQDEEEEDEEEEEVHEQRNLLLHSGCSRPSKLARASRFNSARYRLKRSPAPGTSPPESSNHKTGPAIFEAICKQVPDSLQRKAEKLQRSKKKRFLDHSTDLLKLQSSCSLMMKSNRQQRQERSKVFETMQTSRNQTSFRVSNMPTSILDRIKSNDKILQNKAIFDNIYRKKDRMENGFQCQETYLERDMAGAILRYDFDALRTGQEQDRTEAKYLISFNRTAPALNENFPLLAVGMQFCPPPNEHQENARKHLKRLILTKVSRFATKFILRLGASAKIQKFKHYFKLQREKQQEANFINSEYFDRTETAGGHTINFQTTEDEIAAIDLPMQFMKYLEIEPINIKLSTNPYMEELVSFEATPACYADTLGYKEMRSDKTLEHFPLNLLLRENKLGGLAESANLWLAKKSVFQFCEK